MKAKKLAVYGLLVALAMILSYVEALIPLSFAVPGIKMGLPNIVVLFALYKIGFREAATISLVRVMLSSILFGNMFTLVYSASGAVLSLLVMYLLRRSGKFSTAAVSVAGGVAHNVGQIIVAIFVLETAGLIYYLPALCVSGVVAGLLIGFVSALLIKRVDLKIK
jgi:heptaprenyl diphosphate synthase